MLEPRLKSPCSSLTGTAIFAVFGYIAGNTRLVITLSTYLFKNSALLNGTPNCRGQVSRQLCTLLNQTAGFSTVLKQRFERSDTHPTNRYYLGGMRDGHGLHGYQR